MNALVKLVVATLLLGINVYLLYAFQHYFGINGIEWVYYLGYGVISGFITAVLKDVVQP